MWTKFNHSPLRNRQIYNVYVTQKDNIVSINYVNYDATECTNYFSRENVIEAASTPANCMLLLVSATFKIKKFLPLIILELKVFQETLFVPF